MKKLYALLLLALFCQNLPAQTADEAKSLAIIRENIAAFSKNLVAGNYEAVVAAYTDDAKIFPNNQEILRRWIQRRWTFDLLNAHNPMSNVIKSKICKSCKEETFSA